MNRWLAALIAAVAVALPVGASPSMTIASAPDAPVPFPESAEFVVRVEIPCEETLAPPGSQHIVFDVADADPETIVVTGETSWAGLH